jgi:ankyrin repeat protein
MKTKLVLSNQVVFAGNKLYRYLFAAICNREMKSATLILQKGIGIEFGKDVILNLNDLLFFVDLENNEQFYKYIGKWPMEELDYGLRFAAVNGYMKYCKFLICQGASIKRAGASCILLKKCIDEQDRYLLPYLMQCFESSEVEVAKSRKGKRLEEVKFHLDCSGVQ